MLLEYLEYNNSILAHVTCLNRDTVLAKLLISFLLFSSLASIEIVARQYSTRLSKRSKGGLARGGK